MSRDEDTLLPSVYLNKLPATFVPGARVLVTDPMIATGAPGHIASGCARATWPLPAHCCTGLAGGSLCACLDELLARGAEVSSIRVVGVVAAPPALKRLSETYPGARFHGQKPACSARSAAAACGAHAATAAQGSVYTCP